MAKKRKRGAVRQEEPSPSPQVGSDQSSLLSASTVQ